jgi:transcriptional regulator GlxA family with amidase domain
VDICVNVLRASVIDTNSTASPIVAPIMQAYAATTDEGERSPCQKTTQIDTHHEVSQRRALRHNSIDQTQHCAHIADGWRALRFVAVAVNLRASFEQDMFRANQDVADTEVTNGFRGLKLHLVEPAYLGRSRSVAMIVFDGVRTLDVMGPLEVFDVARSLGCGYQVTLYASAESNSVQCSSGITLNVSPLSKLRRPPDTLLIPGGEILVVPGPSEALINAIRRHAGRARRIASICAGSFAIAAAGLLDGKRATTHWRHLDTFAARFPRVEVDRESVYTHDGAVWSSAGVVAGIDLALALVADDVGSVIAQEISKDMVVFSRRLDGHPQISVAARTPRPKRPELDRLVQDVNANPAASYTLAGVAADIGISARHLARLFKAQVGCTLKEYVQAVRLEGAVGLVLAGESFHAAARRSGLRDAAQIRDFLAADARQHAASTSVRSRRTHGR